MDSAFLFSALSSQQRIDEAAGIIYGVSVITEGEATGKNAGTYIDKTTLSQICKVAEKYPDGVKVKLSQSKEHDGSAGQIVGALRAFSVLGNKTIANLHLLKSDSNFSKIVEMAKIMPSEFGLSVVIPKELQETNGRQYLRCSEIYSIDLVEAPAANPSGLFSQNPPEKNMSNIKYAKGDSGEHAKDCECKECMSKNSKKEMSAYMASLLGLPETSSESEISAAIKTVNAPAAELTALSKQVEDTKAELTKLQSAAANQVALAKRAEIDSLMAEASKNGQIVPLENAELYTVKDGVCAIHMEPAQLSKIIGRCPKKQLAFSKKEAVKPMNAEGKEFDRRTPEGRVALAKWCQEQQTRGAAEISSAFRASRN